MAPVEGAVEAMQRLASEGHHLIVATARHEDSTDATAAWLDQHDIPFDEIRHLENGQKQRLDVDVLVDDYPENVTSFADAGGVGILFEQPWNSDFDPPGGGGGSVHVARGWEEVSAIVGDCSARLDEHRSP